MQIGITLRFHFTQDWMTKLEKKDKKNGSTDVGKEEHLFIVGGSGNWFSYYRNLFGDAKKISKILSIIWSPLGHITKALSVLEIFANPCSFVLYSKCPGNRNSLDAHWLMSNAYVIPTDNGILFSCSGKIVKISYNRWLWKQSILSETQKDKCCMLSIICAC